LGLIDNPAIIHSAHQTTERKKIVLCICEDEEVRVLEEQKLNGKLKQMQFSVTLDN